MRSNGDFSLAHDVEQLELFGDREGGQSSPESFLVL